VNRARLGELLARLPSLRIAVVGDFFLDKYMVVAPELAEVSLETGLEARQVVEIRCSPGAAGTVTNNLSAIGVGRLEAVGVIGDDGQGFELRRGLIANSVGVEGLRSVPERFTPTYTKPMRRDAGCEVEMERLDIKNRAATPPELEDWLIAETRRLATSEKFDAVMLADQVQERNCGVVTDRVREGVRELAVSSKTLFFADSRARIGEFRDLVVKPNALEAAVAMGFHGRDQLSLEQTADFGCRLAGRNRRPVFITLGELGMMACSPDRCVRVQALPPRGPIDIVGAGDSASVGIACALCAGADLEEAAELGNLCASVTIHKLGTTGTASPQELLALVD
jgi:rfaE bifunctional protein kinase chain/domain